MFLNSVRTSKQKVAGGIVVGKNRVGIALNGTDKEEADNVTKMCVASLSCLA